MEAMGTLAGGIAHDFNNLLGGDRRLRSSSLASELGREHPAQRQLERDRAARRERAASLTRQLLAFSRQQTLEPQPLDARPTVRRRRRAAAPLA